VHGAEEGEGNGPKVTILLKCQASLSTPRSMLIKLPHATAEMPLSQECCALQCVRDPVNLSIYSNNKQPIYLRTGFFRMNGSAGAFFLGGATPCAPRGLEGCADCAALWAASAASRSGPLSALGG
jgi:hypothetical protein